MEMKMAIKWKLGLYRGYRGIQVYRYYLHWALKACKYYLLWAIWISLGGLWSTGYYIAVYCTLQVNRKQCYVLFRLLHYCRLFWTETLNPKARFTSNLRGPTLQPWRSDPKCWDTSLIAWYMGVSQNYGSFLGGLNN